MSSSDNDRGRYHGFKLGNSERDRVIRATIERFREEGRDFSDYVKQLVYLDQTGQGSIAEISSQLDQIKIMLQRGVLVAGPEQADDDQSLLDNLLGIDT